MKLSHKSQTQIESAIQKAMHTFPCGCGQPAITDIYLQPNLQSGEFILFDDEDKKLASTLIEEWTECDEEGFYKNTERILRNLLLKEKERGTFEKASILQPYSFVLVDEEKETIAELLLMDNDLMLVNEELLEGLDEELNDFLKNLLEN